MKTKIKLPKLKNRLPPVPRSNSVHKTKKDYKRLKRQTLKKTLDKL